MNRSRFLTLHLVAALVLLAADSAAAETTRTLKIEIPSTEARVAIENLAGSLRVGTGTGNTILVVATVHAETAELAEAVRLEPVGERQGAQTFRVRYPYDRVSTFRYPRSAPADSAVPGWLDWVPGAGKSSTQYDGQKVRVSGSSGTLLYADLEVQLPAREVSVRFRNAVGPIEARDASGELSFETGSGNVAVERLRGNIQIDTGSGDANATDVEGSFTFDAGSGDCKVARFRGDTLTFDVGSGNIAVDSVVAKEISVDAGSGDFSGVAVDVEEFGADTGSGDVDLAVTGSRLVRVDADTGSGDLVLHLGAAASFEATADQGSGDIVSRFPDAQPILKGKELVGYRRGSAQVRITLDAGSGDLVLEP